MKKVTLKITGGRNDRIRLDDEKPSMKEKPKRHRKTIDEKFEETREKYKLLASSMPPEMMDEVLAELPEYERSLFCLISGYQYKGQSKIDVLKGFGITKSFIDKTIAKAVKKVSKKPAAKAKKKTKSK